MTESIKQELQQLETVGRVSVRSQRPVHADFGFESIPRDQGAAPTPSGRAVTESLDDAWSRLKRRIAPE